MEKGKQKLMFAAIAAVGFVMAVSISVIPPAYSIVALILSLVSLGAAVLVMLTKDYSYLLMPIVQMRKGSAVIDSEDPFYMSANGSCIIVREGDLVYATSFIKVPVYSSATEMSDEDKFNFSNLFARLVSISKNTIRISSQLHSINKDEYIARITSKLNEAEGRYNSVQNNKSADVKAQDRVKGEVTMWHNLLDNVSRSNSQALEIYASVSAAGVNEDEAVNLASIKSEEIAAGISATLGVTATVITGNEILMYIEPDHMIPPTTISEMMRYKAKAT